MNRVNYSIEYPKHTLKSLDSLTISLIFRSILYQGLSIPVNSSKNTLESHNLEIYFMCTWQPKFMVWTCQFTIIVTAMHLVASLSIRSLQKHYILYPSLWLKPLSPIFTKVELRPLYKKCQILPNFAALVTLVTILASSLAQNVHNLMAIAEQTRCHCSWCH